MRNTENPLDFTPTFSVGWVLARMRVTARNRLCQKSTVICVALADLLDAMSLDRFSL